MTNLTTKNATEYGEAYLKQKQKARGIHRNLTSSNIKNCELFDKVMNSREKKVEGEEE